ncbi:MAG: hypothetical protein ACUVXJ_14680 [Phycisphaerae bacterium]
MVRKLAFSTLMLISFVVPGVTVSAAGGQAVEGMMTTPGVTGRQVTPHGWSEEKIYVGQLDVGFGAGACTAHTPAGWFSISGREPSTGFPAGTYALFTLSYDSIPAFSCDMNLQVPGGVGKLEKAGLETPAHYSVMYDAKEYEAWGKSPFVNGDDFYQTFVATTHHITRIATRLADKSGDHQILNLNYAVYETNNGPPSTWKKISPVRSRHLSGTTDPIIHIFHVPFRSSEMTLIPGRTYAIRLWRDPSSQSERFALVARTDKGDGYAGGHLFVSDEPRRDLDAFAYVSGGQPGTIVNHAPVGDPNLKQLVGSAKRHGQTFKAGGIGLAGVDVIYATGDPHPPRLPFVFQTYDKPGGKPIGKAKTCYGLPLVFQGRAAAIWSKGDVPLTPGKMYYIEWTSPGSNTWKLNEDLPGEAYVDGVAKPDWDLAMSIVEYADDTPATKPAD